MVPINLLSSYTSIYFWVSRIMATIIAITLHQSVQAMVSTQLGDPKPKSDNRLSINPLRHLDPFGFFLMLIFGYGFGKPVELAPVYYKNRKQGILLVYTIPSVVNLIFGLLFALLLFMIANFSSQPSPNSANPMFLSWLYMFFVALILQLAQINIAFALLHIIPIYPLDGFSVLLQLVKTDTRIKLLQSEKILQLVLIFGIIWKYIPMLIDPIVNLIIGSAYKLFIF